MNINWCKTKELILGSNSAKNFCHELCVDGNVVEHVSVYKLLGVIVDDTLKWKSHVNSICAKASKRLHFLKIPIRNAHICEIYVHICIMYGTYMLIYVSIYVYVYIYVIICDDLYMTYINLVVPYMFNCVTYFLYMLTYM